MKQKEFLNKIKKKVLQEDAEASVILFGSRARGDYKADSDWDVLVLTNKKADANLTRKISDEINDVELEYLQGISTIIIERQIWLTTMLITPLYKNVTAEGVTL
jgi:predicted nucleotidyltransferase